MLAYTVIAGDYPVLERNVEDPRDAGAAADGALAARVAALQRKVEIIGVVGRESFAPRLTFALKDGRRVTGEYHGRELMWDFSRTPRSCAASCPAADRGDRYERFVAAVAGLDKAESVDDVVRLTLPE